VTKYSDKIQEIKTDLLLSSSIINSHIISFIVISSLISVTGILFKISIPYIITGISIVAVIILASLYRLVLKKNRLYVEIFSKFMKENILYKEAEAKILQLLDLSKIPSMLENDKEVIEYNNLAKTVLKDQEIQFMPDGRWCINHVYYKIVRFRLDQNTETDVVALFNEDNNSQDILDFLLRSTVSNSIINQNYDVVSVNPSFMALLNIRENEKCNLFELISESEHQKFYKMIEDINKTGATEPQEFDIPKHKKTISLHMTPVSLSNKLHFICNIFDLTEHKILKMNFVHSQKMQAIGQLAGAIAHDFNNLLTAMIGFCDLLLLRHAPGDSSFNEIMQIKQNANRAAGLVRQLLAFSRKQVLSLKVVDINNVLVELSNLLNRLLGEKIHFDIEYGKHILPVMADQGQFEQVIINLAVNARDAMSKGGNLIIKTSNIKIDDNFQEKEYYSPMGDEPIANGSYVLIEIRDNGTGIPLEIVEHIFEPFFSTKDHFSGTGLGLATVYGIVKQSGGHIRFTTKSNIGTSFFIFLKIADSEIIDAKLAESLEVKPMNRLFMKDTKHTGKILIVEDETPVRLFEVHALNNKGYEVIDTADAESAMTYLESEGHNISIVITDVIMPGITGPQMVEKIREKYPHIKFIFTSGYAEESLSYFDQNEHHFLAKPFTLNELASKVKEVLEEGHE
jgi:two-component system cell cycle sensor histidine kinase/response regulator CckA